MIVHYDQSGRLIGELIRVGGMGGGAAASVTVTGGASGDAAASVDVADKSADKNEYLVESLVGEWAGPIEPPSN